MSGLSSLGVGAHKQRMPRREDALPGRDAEMPLRNAHHVHGRPLRDAFPGMERVQFGMGCFWGAERIFWSMPGVVTTAVGYSGGTTPNPTYNEACTGRTGHAEVVLVAYDPKRISYEQLLKTFWEDHDPTQGFRQGNDIGTQYRSIILTTDDEQQRIAETSRDAYQAMLSAAGYGEIKTEIRSAGPFYYAEDYHQQYLDKVVNSPSHAGMNPYCPIHATGVKLPDGFADVKPLQLVD